MTSLRLLLTAAEAFGIGLIIWLAQEHHEVLAAIVGTATVALAWTEGHKKWGSPYG